MFCSKCGNQIPENSAFCENCGTPVRIPEQPAGDASYQPKHEEQTEAPEYSQAPASPQEQFPDEPQQYPNQPQQQYPNQPQQYGYAPAPAPVKKPMSPKTKKIIIFSAIGAGALAIILVALFVFIIPAIKDANTTKIKLADYRTIRFENIDYDNPSAKNEVLDGKIAGTVVWNAEKLAKDINVDKNVAEKILSNYANSLSKEHKLNGKSFSSSFSGASKDDIITATVFWPGDGDGNILSQLAEKSINNRVEQLEDQYDIKIVRETTTAEIKISDVLEEQNITVTQPVEVDMLGKIVDGGYIEVVPDYDEYCELKTKKFSFEDNGFKFTHDIGSGDVNILKDGKEIASVYLNFSDKYYLKNNDKVTISIDSYYVTSLEEKGLKLTRDIIDYTVKYEAETTAPTTEPETTAPTTAPATTAPETTAPATTAPETTAANTTEATKAA